MKIIIAPDSFKGSLTAKEAASAMARGVRAIAPNAEIDIIPLADGGEGTLEALVASTHGQFKQVGASDPLGRSINGQYGVLGDGKTIVIEMSVVSGLLLLKENERNPLFTTTYGTGQLIREALDSGCRELIVGIGGSSTNDCGAGMAQALGVRFFRNDKTEILDKICGKLLADVAAIDNSRIHPTVRSAHITVACDVRNPLLGENGCTYVYAPQKGAKPEIVKQLEKNMTSFIDIAEKTINRSVRDIPGAGAAGGLGAGLMLFLGAKLQPGIDIVMDACGFSERIKDADFILTGEGKIDSQTAFGKTIAGIASSAKLRKISVIAFAGKVENTDNLYRSGVISCHSISPKTMTLEQSMANAATLLQRAVERVMRETLSGL
jgi:glycerate kinase